MIKVCVQTVHSLDNSRLSCLLSVLEELSFILTINGDFQVTYMSFILLSSVMNAWLFEDTRVCVSLSFSSEYHNFEIMSPDGKTQHKTQSDQTVNFV